MCPNLHKNNHNKLIIHWQCSHTAFPLTESIDWMTLKIQQIYVYRSFVQSHLYWALCFIIWQRGNMRKWPQYSFPFHWLPKPSPSMVELELVVSLAVKELSDCCIGSYAKEGCQCSYLCWPHSPEFIKRERLHLPLKQDTVGQLAGAKLLSKLEAVNLDRWKQLLATL